jgi:hypothetical protein
VDVPQYQGEQPVQFVFVQICQFSACDRSHVLPPRLEAPTPEAFHASREGAALGVSRIRRTETKRRSLALAASHAGTCETGIFKRHWMKGSLERERERLTRVRTLNCAASQTGTESMRRLY